VAIARRVALFLIASCGFSCAAAQEVTSSKLHSVLPSPAASIQDFSQTVVPISDLKPRILPGPGLYPRLGVQEYLGTGFCLDPACRFVATCYHVAAGARPHKIKGDKIIKKFLATGPKDDGATLHIVPGEGSMVYNTNRDLAVFELRKPLANHHGITFSADDLEVGQKADIYGYPLEGLNPFRKLLRFPATYSGKTATGLLVFDYKLSGNKGIRLGASGGIVVDRKTQQVVGVLTEGGNSANLLAVAVPIQSLMEFVSKVQPFLARDIFPLMRPVMFISADLYPKFVPARAEVLRRRPEEPYEVSLLRKKAQLLADSMRNFIAVQTFAWGSGNKEPAEETSYEVRVIDGVQRFREYPAGKKELWHVPFPALSGWVLPSDQWSRLPQMVGTELRLKVRQAADVVVGGRKMKVFQYYASLEDDLCPFAPVEDFGLFTIRKTVAVACYGEVWTDEDTNIVRMSENLELSDKRKAYRGWENYQIVLTYGWLRKANEPSQLVPLTSFAQGRHGKHIYWCRGQFTNYQLFRAHAKLITN
jgi:hypothetical protein